MLFPTLNVAGSCRRTPWDGPTLEMQQGMRPRPALAYGSTQSFRLAFNGRRYSGSFLPAINQRVAFGGLLACVQW